MNPNITSNADPSIAMLTVWTYIAYLTISALFTVWVARTLGKNGRAFLIDAFGQESIADSVNHLLVVGFYLINLGYITMTLKLGYLKPQDLASCIEALSGKIGSVLIVLGLMHFANLYIFSRMRRQSTVARQPHSSAPAAA